MKKTITTIAIVFGITMSALAQQYTGGLFQRGMVSDEVYYGGGYGYDDYYDYRGTGLFLPIHGETDNQDAPLGSGITLLLGMGGTYLFAKRRKEEE